MFKIVLRGGRTVDRPAGCILYIGYIGDGPEAIMLQFEDEVIVVERSGYPGRRDQGDAREHT